MRIFRAVFLTGLSAVCIGLVGRIAYVQYKNSQPPSFSAERFVRLCRPQLEAGAKALKRQQEVAVAEATSAYLYAPASATGAEMKRKVEEAQAALDDTRANGIYSKSGFLAKNADWFGRLDDADMARSNLGLFDNDPDNKAAAACMLNGKLGQVEGRPVGDEYIDVPPKVVALPLKESEMRVAFQNGCGAVMASSASKSALDDTVWMGACNFGLAHGKGLRQWRGTLTPVTYFYGYNITPGQEGGDGAMGNPVEIAARFKPLEAARLQRIRTMLAARATESSVKSSRGRSH